MGEDDVVLSDVHVDPCSFCAAPSLSGDDATPEAATAEKTWMTTFELVLDDDDDDDAADATDAAEEPRRTPIAPGTQVVPVDADGDLAPPRPPPKKTRRLLRAPHARTTRLLEIRVEHALATSVARVGAQVWRGGLVLCDHVAAHPELVRGRRVVELGAGVGVTAIVAARLGAARVVVTDALEEALELARRNARQHFAGSAVSGLETQCRPVVDVRPVDWTRPETWSALEGADTVLAADVVYDDDATAALFDVVRWLCRDSSASSSVKKRRRRGAPTTGPSSRCGLVIVVSLELRFNFEADSLSVRAHGYRRFRAELARGVEEGCFRVERRPLSVQRLRGYDRGGPETERCFEIWELRPPLVYTAEDAS